MKSSLEHLPESKRRELARVVEILFAEFQDAIVLGAQPHKRMGRILKVLLYGSYARGDWVSDPVGGYISDYDLLTDMVEYWSKAEEHLLQEQTIAHRLTAPVSLIVHSLGEYASGADSGAAPYSRHSSRSMRRPGWDRDSAKTWPSNPGEF